VSVQLHRALTAVAFSAAAVVCAGCSSAPEVTLAPLAGQPACANATWPSTVGGRQQITTAPEDASAAAWGSPAIIARCGLVAPAPTTDSCVSVDGVDWVVRELSDGSGATTYGREPAVEVLAPSAHGPVTLLLPAFSAVAKALPETGRHCS
jgi:hypothetical protein